MHIFIDLPWSRYSTKIWRISSNLSPENWEKYSLVAYFIVEYYIFGINVLADISSGSENLFFIKKLIFPFLAPFHDQLNLKEIQILKTENLFITRKNFPQFYTYTYIYINPTGAIPNV